MSAPRFEIVRTDAAQPWHARFRAANGRVVWTTENYARWSAASRAVDLLCAALDLYAQSTFEVRDVDERYTPPPVVLEPPFYFRYTTRYAREGRRTTTEQVEWWHDREIHSRNCFDEDCTEVEPVKGTVVAGRFGSAVAP